MTVELVARRQADLEQGHANYHVYAGEQLVGCIYQQAPGHWRWAINTVMVDATIGMPLSGYAADMAEAQAHLRPAFERWLEWATAVPESDLKRGPLDRNLRAIGLR